MFDLAALREAVERHGRVARVVIASLEGSSPREPGAAMLVWAGGQSGSIGGGALEWAARGRAEAMLGQDVRVRLDREALGPTLGQCCGGSVLVLTELWEAGRMPVVEDGMVVRRVGTSHGDGGAVPPALLRAGPSALYLQGWMAEPVAAPDRTLWVWGAGHVGRAVVGVMAPLPGLAITWVDVAADRYPRVIPDGVTVLPASAPEHLVSRAAPDAEHLVLTYSHALDLELCHRLLEHGFGRAGLIGSATKAARFRSRLGALGHSAPEIARIACPIGDPALGKHPQAIALGVAVAFLHAPALQREAV